MHQPALLGSYWTLAVGAEIAHGDQRHCPHDFRARVEAAARAGYTGMGFWHDDLRRLREAPGFREMKAILDANGIGDIEVEWLLDWYGTGARRAASDATRALLLDAAEALGARHIKVADMRNDGAGLPQMTEAFARLCREAAARGTCVLFEMLPAALSRLPTLDQAVALCRGSGEPNGGLMLDIVHCVRTGTTPADLMATLRPTDLLGFEINDGRLAAPDDLLDSITHRRLLPGDGEFDITGFLDAANRLGCRGPIGVEVLSETLRRMTLGEAATLSHAKARAAVAKVQWQ